MSEQELYIQAHTGSDGIAHIDIDIPTGIVDQDIEVTVSYSTLKDSSLNSKDVELEQVLANAKPAIDMSKFCGVIRLTEDPLEYQRRIRDEW
ncbi:MAG: hypothetical protein AAGE84_05990 [Cyanobacteria bacterium P01_G01_bin.39]